jgi:nicotinamidase-related amidase
MNVDKSALLVMDMQPEVIDMLAPGGSRQALQRATIAVKGARSIGIPVIFVRVAYRANYIDVSPRNKRGSILKERGVLSELSAATELCPELDARPDDPVVLKRRVGAFSFTDLPTLLSGQRIDRLILAGMATSGVVLTTVRQAADHDYRIVVLEDACADNDPEVHKLLMTKIFPFQAEVATVAEHFQVRC